MLTSNSTKVFSERLNAKVDVLEVKKEEDEDHFRVEAHVEARVDIKPEIKSEEVFEKKRPLAADEITATPLPTKRRRVLTRA